MADKPKIEQSTLRGIGKLAFDLKYYPPHVVHVIPHGPPPTGHATYHDVAVCGEKYFKGGPDGMALEEYERRHDLVLCDECAPALA